MGNLTWRLKELFRKLLPIALIGAVIYFGFNFYKHGGFRRGVGPAMTHMLRKIPFFGSTFRHYGRSYSYAWPGHRGHRHWRRHGHHRRGRHHRHRY